MNAPALITGPIRFSHLRAYGKSGAHGLLARLGGGEETDAMELGTAVHALLFGTAPVIAYAGKVRRGKEYDQFVLDHPDYEILTGSAYGKANNMAEAVSNSALAMSVLKGTVETTILFKFLGLECRVTPDVRGTTYVTELKTTQSADPNVFIWHALRMHYHGQLAFQRQGCASMGLNIADAYIVAVESTAPFLTTVLHVSARAMEAGEKLCHLWMERLRGCEDARVWPGYVESMIELDIPEAAVELEY